MDSSLTSIAGAKSDINSKSRSFITVHDSTITNGVEMITIACPMCGAHNDQVLYRPWNTGVDPRTVLSASGGIKGTQTIVKCKSCGLIYVNPRPRGDTVISCYAAANNEFYQGAALGRITTFDRCAAYLKDYLQPGKLLDIGCASGMFVKAARDNGWDASGVEPCDWLADIGQREFDVPILSGTLKDLALKPDSVDAVTMWDVLEHVPDPMAELVEINRVLRPGGMLLINYPDAGTWFARLTGKYWWFYLSVHLTYFSQQTLKMMLKKTGFDGFVARKHFQSLNLGFLIKMGGLYSQFLSKVGGELARVLKLQDVLFHYYAGQTTMICYKNGK